MISTKLTNGEWTGMTGENRVEPNARFSIDLTPPADNLLGVESVFVCDSPHNERPISQTLHYLPESLFYIEPIGLKNNVADVVLSFNLEEYYNSNEDVRRLCEQVLNNKKLLYVKVRLNEHKRRTIQAQLTRWEKESESIPKESQES